MSNTIIDPRKKPKHAFSGTVEAHVEDRPDFKSTEILDFCTHYRKNNVSLSSDGASEHSGNPVTPHFLSFKTDISNGLHHFTADGAILEFSTRKTIRLEGAIVT